MCIKHINNITEKRKTMKSHLETQGFKMTRLATEKFPQGKWCQMLIVEDVIQETFWE